MDPALTRLAQGCSFLGVAGFLGKCCIFNVDGGEEAVMWKVIGGIQEKTYSEGSHLFIPWLYRPTIYNIRLRPKLIQTTTGTKDMQMVTVHVRLLYKPISSKLARIHSTLGPDYDERVLPSIGNEVLKSIVAHYDAEQLLTQRDKVSAAIRDAIIQRARAFDIELEDVAITHLNYGKEFSRAIEEKQVAEQEAERQKFVVAKTEQERIATVIKAEGEAEAADMISRALKEHGTGLIEVRRIDAAKDIATILSKSPNVMYVPGNGQNMLLNLPAGGR